MEWYLAVLKQYAVFSGRARRQEYWMFFLVNMIISFVLGIIDGLLGTAFIGFLYSLAILIPSLAVLARRLHDTGRSGWWILIGLIPLIGILVLLYFTVQDSVPGTNEYGANPKENASQDEDKLVV
ncbi:DUF805 domain-containing protein [Vibrio sp. NTOU-M3]|uniref:DUF805 domain-containing protein n=1 Tax=Vibrio sp. NTOU-M3 TaxID=3234954 RepID=UPI00349FBD99